MWYIFIHSQYFAHICLHTSVGIHCTIDLLSPIILCFADGMCQPPPCRCASFFPLPLYRQTGKQMIILWTHYSAWSSYHNKPSWVSNLGCAKLCFVYNVAFISVLLFFFPFPSAGAREGSQKSRMEKETWVGGGVEKDCLHTFAHLSPGNFYQS